MEMENAKVQNSNKEEMYLDRYPEINGTKISEKYCCLLIDIAKEIFTQYVEQLKSAQAELSGLLNNDERYKGSSSDMDYYKKLSYAVTLSENILANFDRNVFWGIISDNYLSYFDYSGTEKKVSLSLEQTKPQIERFAAFKGITELFEIVGIPADVLTTAINYSKDNLFLNNSYDGSLRLKELEAKNEQVESHLSVPLIFNNVLASNLYGNSIRVEDGEGQKVFYKVDFNAPYPGKQFKIDMSKVYAIIDKFIQGEFQNVSAEDINAKNMIAQGTFYNIFDIYKSHGAADVKDFMIDKESYLPFG